MACTPRVSCSTVDESGRNSSHVAWMVGVSHTSMPKHHSRFLATASCQRLRLGGNPVPARTVAYPRSPPILKDSIGVVASLERVENHVALRVEHEADHRPGSRLRPRILLLQLGAELLPAKAELESVVDVTDELAAGNVDDCR